MAFDQLSSTVYIAARAGAVDCTAAFDLAAGWLEYHPQDPDAAELALLSIECTEASQPRTVQAALRLLATANFRPGFKEEPGWLIGLEGAMRQVNRGVAATGIDHPCRLRVLDGEGTPRATPTSRPGKGTPAHPEGFSLPAALTRCRRW